MCTGLALQGSDTFYFGRNLDLDVGFGQCVVVTPRDFTFHFRDGLTDSKHEAFIGMATVIAGYPLYAEATNESGLSIAGLNFPSNAQYHTRNDDSTNVAPFELIPYVLTQCKTLVDVRELLTTLNIMDEAFAEKIPNSPLHWIVADKTGTLVIESMSDGLHWYENPLHVLTNNPPFPYHLENVKLYMNTMAAWPKNSFAEDVSLSPVGVGFGMHGIPGDTSPASRFVKAAFERANTVAHSSKIDVSQFFHILSSVAMVAGDTLNKQNHIESTLYSCCCDTQTGTYYYKTYNNSQISAVRMGAEERNGSELKQFPLVDVEQIAYAN